MTSAPTDLVVLLDDDGEPCGTADRLSVHTDRTPLHLAFSCYVVDGQGRILMTRRALSKRTWPGVWTNACCGHPMPGESFGDAITRRLEQELGTSPSAIAPVLPDFRYTAIDASGVVENEICPVFVAMLGTDLRPNRAEVVEHAWADPAALATVARETPWLLSPWSVAQITRLDLANLAVALRVNS